MKNLIALSLLLVSSVTNAQEFTLAKLQEYNKHSFEDFKTEVKSKGFIYHDKTNSEAFDLYEYSKFENKISYKIAKSISKDALFTYISYDTSNKKEFDLFINDIKKFGYKLTEKGTNYKIPFEVYTLNKKEIWFNFPDPNDKNLKSYNITVY